MLDEEQEKKNSSKGTYYRDPNYEIHSADYDMSTEVDVAEIISKRPYMCKSLPKPTEAQLSAVKTQPYEAGKQYSFDIAMADQIFDYMIADRQIRLPHNVKLPSTSELKGKEYCKWHNSWRHGTNNCLVFRNILQDMIEKGNLKFEKEKEVMGIDGDPFPSNLGINTVTPNFEILKRARQLEEGDLRHKLASKVTSNKEEAEAKINPSLH